MKTIKTGILTKIISCFLCTAITLQVGLALTVEKVNADGTTTTTPKRKPKTTVEKAKEKEAVAEAEAQNAVLENAVDTVQAVDTNPAADVVQTTESNE